MSRNTRSGEAPLTELSNNLVTNSRPPGSPTNGQWEGGEGLDWSAAPMLPSEEEPRQGDISGPYCAGLQRQNRQLKLVAAGAAVVALISIVTVLVVGLSHNSSTSSRLQVPTPVAESPFFSGRLHDLFGAVANQLITTATTSPLVGLALYERLKHLCYTFGPRLSGTTPLEDAIQWVKDQMLLDGLENVRLEPVEGVPNWRRGQEEVVMLKPREAKLTMVGLGGSVPGNVTAPVISLRSFSELAARAPEANGAIVLFNVPFTTYGETVAYRYSGATAAAKAGAVAVLIRSVSSASMDNPHTGALSYKLGDSEGVPRIPAAAVSTEAADLLQWLLDTNQTVVLRLQMGCSFGPPANSSNILAEVTGREKPEEVVLLGGHIDSWDVGLGAMDDGAGLLVCWEAVRLIHTLGLRPRRTVRVVGWVNEESGNITGTMGAIAYAQRHLNEKHVLAVESDSGAFSPEGFDYVGGAGPLATVQSIAATLLKPLNATEVLSRTESGADVMPLYHTQGTPALELKTNGTKYFWYHHSAADTPDKLVPKELAECAAALAVLVYTVADMPDFSSVG